jgi:FixJ family two-component response regulator
VAHRLGLSQRTVENHRARAMQKLGFRSLAQLVRLAVAADAGGFQVFAR